MAEVLREKILVLLGQEPQTSAIERQVEFLKEQLNNVTIQIENVKESPLQEIRKRKCTVMEGTVLCCKCHF